MGRSNHNLTLLRKAEPPTMQVVTMQLHKQDIDYPAKSVSLGTDYNNDVPVAIVLRLEVTDHQYTSFEFTAETFQDFIDHCHVMLTNYTTEKTQLKKERKK
jgi:hypothetical protein